MTVDITRRRRHFMNHSQYVEAEEEQITKKRTDNNKHNK